MNSLRKVVSVLVGAISSLYVAFVLFMTLNQSVEADRAHSTLDFQEIEAAFVQSSNFIEDFR